MLSNVDVTNLDYHHVFKGAASLCESAFTVAQSITSIYLIYCWFIGNLEVCIYCMRWWVTNSNSVVSLVKIFNIWSFCLVFYIQRGASPYQILHWRCCWLWEWFLKCYDFLFWFLLDSIYLHHNCVYENMHPSNNPLGFLVSWHFSCTFFASIFKFPRNSI